MFIKKYHHFEYHHSKLNIHLELHWRYDSHCFPFDFKGIWKERRKVNISGYGITTLSDEDNFLYLIFHGAKHGWVRLRWLCDIYEMIKSNQLNWQRVRRKAEAMQILHMVLQSILLVHLIFEANIPNPFNGLIEKDGKAYKLAKMAIPYITTFEGALIRRRSKLYIHNKKYMFLLVYGMKNKVKYFLQCFYPSPEDFKVLQLKDSLFSLYFIGKPFFSFYRVFYINFKAK